jgi:hypothetical protein
MSGRTIRNGHLATIAVHYIFVILLSLFNATDNQTGLQITIGSLGFMTALSLIPILTTRSTCQRVSGTHTTDISVKNIRNTHLFSIFAHFAIVSGLYYSSSISSRYSIQIFTLILGIMTTMALYPIVMKTYTCSNDRG